MKQKEHSKTVFGIQAVGPKLTRSGLWLIIRWGVLPVLGFLLALDGLGYLIAKYIFASCYGILCLV